MAGQDNYFRYRALDTAGQMREGTLAAADERQALDALTARGLHLAEIHEVEPTARPRRWFRRPLTARQITGWTGQLATLVKAGVHLTEALRILLEQAESEELADLILDLRRRIDAGESTTKAFAAHVGVLGERYLAMVRAGDEGRSLGESLERLAMMRDHDEDLVDRVRNALIMPTILAVVVLVVSILLVAFVIPTIASTYVGREDTLPLPTVLLMGLSSLVVENGLFLAGALLAAVVAVGAYVRTDPGRRRSDRAVLEFPFVGPFVRLVAASRLSRMLGSLVQKGVDTREALQICRDIPGNLFFGEAIDEICTAMAKGQAFSERLKDSGLFPPLVVHMARLGDETGQLGLMLDRAADRLEKDVSATLEGSLKLIEPAMTIVLSVVVGMVMMALLLPMMDMLNNLE